MRSGKCPRRIALGLALCVATCASVTAETCSGVYALEDSDWYERQMTAAGARPLCSTRSSAIERYRLVWLRSFHNPIVVTLVRNSNSIKLTAVRLNGAGGYRPGRVVETKHVTLSVAEFEKFSEHLRQMDFWNLEGERQRRERESKTGEIIVQTDGAHWILEGANEKLAHASDRGSDVDGAFQEAALFLLQKSGIDLNGPLY